MAEHATPEYGDDSVLDVNEFYRPGTESERLELQREADRRFRVCYERLILLRDNTENGDAAKQPEWIIQMTESAMRDIDAGLGFLRAAYAPPGAMSDNREELAFWERSVKELPDSAPIESAEVVET